MKQKPSKFQYYAVFQLRNLIYYLNACCKLYHIPKMYGQWDSDHSCLCVDMASIMVSWYTYCKLVKDYPQNFRGASSFYGSNIFILNLKPDDGFLPYSMSEGFSKTGHGLTDIIIAWAEFKSVLLLELFQYNGTYINSVLEWNWRPSTMVEGSVKNLFGN